MFPIGKIKLNATTESDKHTLKNAPDTELKYQFTASV